MFFKKLKLFCKKLLTKRKQCAILISVARATDSDSKTNGSVPEWPKGADCKSVVCDFGGPNPPAPTKKKDFRKKVLFSLLTMGASKIVYMKGQGSFQ